MKFKTIIASLGLAAATLLNISFAQAQSQEFKAVVVDAAKSAQLITNLNKNMPGMSKIDEIMTTPLPGLYEVRMDRNIFYSNEAGTYFFNGHIIEGASQRNLTKAKLDKLSAVDFGSLPYNDAIKVVQGNGARKIVVFADPNCGYCKRFENTLSGVDNVTIYTFLMPILGDDSVTKSRDIWCSKDRAKTWKNWMINAVPFESYKGGKCDVDAIVRNVNLGKKLGIRGTPGLFFEDGSRYPGAMQGEELQKKLDSIAAATKVAKK